MTNRAKNDFSTIKHQKIFDFDQKCFISAKIGQNIFPLYQFVIYNILRSDMCGSGFHSFFSVIL